MNLCVAILRGRRLSTSVTALIILIIGSSSCYGLTLSDAVTKTLAHNPELRPFALQRDSLSAQTRNAEQKPALNINVAVDSFGKSQKNAGLDHSEATLSLSSVIERKGQRQARVNLAKAHFNRLEIRQRLTTLAVLTALSNSYISALASQQSLLLSAQRVKQIKAMHNTVKQRVQRGASPDTELLRSKAQLETASAQHEALKQTLKRNKLSLSLFWGSTNPSFAKLDGDLFTLPQADKFSTASKRLEHASALQDYASTVHIEKKKLQLAKSKQASPIAWELGIKRDQSTDDTVLLAGASWELGSRQRQQHTLTQLRAEHGIALSRHDSAKLTLYQQLFNAYSLRDTHLNTASRLQDTIIPLRQRTLALARDAYEQGRDNYQDWHIAQEELRQSRQQLIDSAAAAHHQQSLIDQLTDTLPQPNEVTPQ